jgi:hypothetical protein
MGLRAVPARRARQPPQAGLLATSLVPAWLSVHTKRVYVLLLAIKALAAALVFLFKLAGRLK